MESNSSANKFKVILAVLVIGGVLFLINYVPTGDKIRNWVSYIYNPFSLPTYRAGLNSADYFRLFSNVTAVNNENEKLKAEVVKLRAEKNSQSLLAEENQQLKKLKVLDYKELKFKMIDMFVDEKNGEEGFLLLGKRDGIEKGNIVQYGGVYAGVITSVDETSSIVKLPTSTSSSVKISIIKAFNWNNLSQASIDSQVKSAFKSNGVAIGNKSGVIIQNIKAGAGVSDGDVVVVNDERVGRHLILGTIKELNQDPAVASLNAKVSLLIDYQSLNSYFIEIK